VTKEENNSPKEDELSIRAQYFGAGHRSAVS
jgi:hypothetical protein